MGSVACWRWRAPLWGAIQLVGIPLWGAPHQRQITLIHDKEAVCRPNRWHGFCAAPKGGLRLSSLTLRSWEDVELMIPALYNEVKISCLVNLLQRIYPNCAARRGDRLDKNLNHHDLKMPVGRRFASTHPRKQGP